MEGKHTVEFVFNPLSFEIGWRISAATAVVMGALFLMGYLKRTAPDR